MVSVANDYRDYRRMGHSRYRSAVLTFWDIPFIARIFG
jgi:hypothetical protein